MENGLNGRHRAVRPFLSFRRLAYCVAWYMYKRLIIKHNSQLEVNKRFSSTRWATLYRVLISNEAFTDWTTLIDPQGGNQNGASGFLQPVVNVFFDRTLTNSTLTTGETHSDSWIPWIIDSRSVFRIPGFQSTQWCVVLSNELKFARDGEGELARLRNF